jgi:hypothetical protein
MFKKYWPCLTARHPKRLLRTVLVLLALALLATACAGGQAGTDGTSPTEQPISSSAAASNPNAQGVSLSIDCSAALAKGFGQYPGGEILPKSAVEIADGDSVLDVLRRCGVEIEVSESWLGSYVAAIGGLREKAYGGASGWTFELNGSQPAKSCDKCPVTDGDSIVWRYVTAGR